MKSLDEMLSEIAQEKFQASLNEAISIDTWTPENRDQKMLAIRHIAEQLSLETIQFLKDLIAKDLNGKPYLASKLMEQYLAGEIELLTGMREELDNNLTPESLPIDYSWLNSNIRSRYLELKELMDQNIAALEPEIKEL